MHNADPYIVVFIGNLKKSRLRDNFSQNSIRGIQKIK